MTRCGWLRRWWHNRQRLADINLMWSAFVSQSDTMAEAYQAWQVFIHMPGQEHWLCECGKRFSQK